MDAVCDCMLQIKTLGSFETILDGVVIPERAWPRRKTRELLKVLLTAPGDVFTVDQLIDAILPDADVSRARSNIGARISELRSVLEPGLHRGIDSQYIKRVGEGYMFNVDSDSWLDSLEFDRLCTEALHQADEDQWAEAVDRFEMAAVLYRGDFLAEDRYAEWAESARAHLRETYLEGLTRLATCYARLNRLCQAASSYRKVLESDSCREAAARQLMEVLSAAGRHAQAVLTYKKLEQSLHERLDVEPSEETLQLFQQLSRREPVRTERFDPLRVAVVPFVNVGSDPANDFLADGMTEELIYTLSKVAGLEVIAQTSVLKYKGVRKSVREIGRELHAGSVIEGSAQRVSDKARVLVQLVDVENEAHLWAEQYDRELQDVLSVQGEIARQVAEALEVTLLAKEERAIRREDAVSAEARTAYMKGRLFLSRRTRAGYEKAIACLETALAIAPDYARALTGLADVYALRVGLISSGEELEKARGYVQRALELDPSCAEAHATLAYILWDDSDVKNAEEELLRAIELNPNYAQAHEWYAGLLTDTGRVKEACTRSEIALALDPLSATVNLTYAESLRWAGRLVEAVGQYERALELNSALDGAWWGLWYSLAAQWDWDQVEVVTRRCVERYPDNPFAHVNLAQSLACLQRSEEGLAEIRKALDIAGDPAPPYILLHAGYAHYFAGQYDQAIGYLQQVLKKTPTWTFVHAAIGKCHLQLGRYDEALVELNVGERASLGPDDFWNAHLHMDRGKIYALRGETEKAEAELAILMRGPGKRNRYLAMSGILFALGRTEEAMDRLEAAATAREAHVAALGKDPGFDEMRSHPRFQAVLKRIGLAD